MKTFLFRAGFLLFGLLFPLRAAEPVMLQGVVMPEYDATGRLVRRLQAASIRDPLKIPLLTDGHVEFYGREAAKVVADLVFADAKYDAGSHAISGAGPLKFSFSDRTISGLGYEGDIAAGRLEIRAAVVAEVKGYRLTGPSAEVSFDPKAPEKEIVREIIMPGPVEITPLAGRKLGNDLVRVQAPGARYDAARQVVVVRGPAVGWTKEGDRRELNTAEGFLTYDLRDEPMGGPAGSK